MIVLFEYFKFYYYKVNKFFNSNSFEIEVPINSCGVSEIFDRFCTNEQLFKILHDVPTCTVRKYNFWSGSKLFLIKEKGEVKISVDK